jgi:hypothetical protein
MGGSEHIWYSVKFEVILAIGVEVDDSCPPIGTASRGHEAREVAGEVVAGVGIDPDGEEGGEASDDVPGAVSSSIGRAWTD